jgi:predicted nucleic acid-binding protein
MILSWDVIVLYRLFRMPDYQIAETVLNIARNAVLLDTNVLVEAFSSSDNSGRQEYAELFLAEIEAPLLVPTVVLIEAWGLLVGRNRAWPAGLDLLTWLNRPGQATIVPPYHKDMQRTQRNVESWYVDIVDAMLVELATDITERCDLRPPLLIATFDTSDFTRMAGKPDLRFRIYDMRSREEIEID